MPCLQGEKVLVAGATGQVGLPLTLPLAGDNEVWATARFGDPAARATLESAGVACVATDLVEDWCTYLGGLLGVEPTFQPTDETIGSVTVDLTLMHALVGHARVPWREGFARMVAARAASPTGRKRA